jgi:hypothetical protein
METVALDATGMPELQVDEVFKQTFHRVSLICGGEHDLGCGQLHTTSSCAAVPKPRCPMRRCRFRPRRARQMCLLNHASSSA